MVIRKKQKRKLHLAASPVSLVLPGMYTPAVTHKMGDSNSRCYTHGFGRRSLHVLRESLKEAMSELRKSPTGQQLTAVRVHAKQVDNDAFNVRK